MHLEQHQLGNMRRDDYCPARKVTYIHRFSRPRLHGLAKEAPLTDHILSDGLVDAVRTPICEDVQLILGEQTIKTHVSNILSKLHLADRTQAAIYALQQRLVPLDDALK